PVLLPITYPPAAPAAPPITAPRARFFVTDAPTAAPVAPPTTAPCCPAVPGALLHPESPSPAQIVPMKSSSFFISKPRGRPCVRQCGLRPLIAPNNTGRSIGVLPKNLARRVFSF